MSDVAARSTESVQPTLATRWRDNLRLGRRLGVLGLVTFFYWLGLTLETWLNRREQPFTITNRWVARWARTFFRIFGITVHAEGPHVGQGQLYPGSDSNGVGRIFVLNHRSLVDIPLAQCLLAAHPISRHDIAAWPVIGSLAKRLGTLFVDRQSRRSGAAVLKQVDATLQDGEGVVMFPEGTSYRGDEVRDFRPGAFKAAARAGSEIVPLGVAYEDDNACYYHEPFSTHMKRVARRRRLQVAVVAGEPIAQEGRTPVEMKELLHGRVQQLTQRARAALGK